MKEVSYTRQNAMEDGLIIDIKPPLFNDNPKLFMLLQHNDSIVATVTLFEILNGLVNETVSVQDNIQNVGWRFIEEIRRAKDEDKLPAGNTIIFNVAFVLENVSIKKRIKAITHPEPNFGGKEIARCITFMMEDET